MKIIVLIKKTPDTESKITLNGDQTAIDHNNTKFIMNPYDEFALEEAVKIKEANGSGEVVVVSLADENMRENMIKALAKGGDRAILVNDDGLDTADSLTVAKILAAVVKAEDAKLVLCGKQAIDDDNMHVPTMVAEYLDWPQVNVATKVELNDETATIEREVEGGQIEVYETSLPAVIGAHKSLNSPRYASLPGIMKAKKKPFEVKSPSDYGLDTAQLNATSKVKITGYTFPPEKKAGQVFKGEAVEDMVGKVVKLLRDEAKVL